MSRIWVSPRPPAHSYPRPRRVWTDEQITRLVAGRQAGQGVPALSAALGVPKTTLARKLAELGVTAPPRSLMPVPDQQQIIYYYRSGLSEHAVAEKVGRSRDTVRGVLDRAGVQRRSRARRGPPPRPHPRPFWASAQGQP